jgi:acetylglutamate synthase
MPSIPGFSVLTEAHEGRLQRLETRVSEVGANVAVTSEKIDHLTSKIEDGFHSVSARLDKGQQQFDLHEAQLNEHKAEIAKIQADEATRAKRWATVKRGSIALIGAAAGVVATKSGESLWNLIVHLFK